MRVPYDALRIGFDVVADMLRGSLFRADDIEKEREVITEEIRGINDIPDEVVGELIDRARLAGCSSRASDRWF